MSTTAILIDWENIWWSLEKPKLDITLDRVLGAVRRTIPAVGTCTWLAYADFDMEELRGHMTELQRRNVDVRHVFSKHYAEHRKNASDIEMSLDALQLSYDHPEIGTYVLVGGDRDFIQVVRKLTTRGKHVHMVGSRRTLAGDLDRFCEVFTIEQLIGEENDATENAIVALDDELRSGKPFVGMKLFLRRLNGGKSAVPREVFQLVNGMVDQNIILTYKVDNPVNPTCPTAACQLNLEHPQVKAALAKSPRTITS